MQIAKLGLAIDASQATEAVETLKALADAAERASAALDQLAGKEHGGLTIEIVGAVGLIEIKPVSTDPGQSGKAMADHIGAEHVNKTGPASL